MIGFTIIDNSDKVLAEFERKKERALNSIGEKAIGYAKGDTPVDTSRLKNSEDFRVMGNDVYIGTNVEYAPYIEFGHHSYTGRHMLKNAAANHADEYKNILKTSMEA